MARTRKQRTPSATTTTTTTQPPPLAHPDRSKAPSIDDQTLYKIAEQRQLFQQAAARELKSNVAVKKIRLGNQDDDSSSDDDDDTENEVPTLSLGAERILEAMLWTTSLAMLHFTFDVLVQHQYGTTIAWRQVCHRTLSAWAGTFWRAAGVSATLTLY